MKKFLIILSSLFALLLIAIILIPIIFKDDIKAAIDEKLAETVNAEIVFDIDDFSLSLLPNFPNLTVEINNFSVINKAPFEGNKLLGVNSLELEVNLKSIIIDGDMRLKGITLDRPHIYVHVLEDGSANYDIMIPSEDSVKTEEPTVAEEPTKFDFAIDHWAINEAKLIYIDATLPIQLELHNLNHTGSGTFSDELFDLTTATTVDTVNVSYGGVSYMTNKKLSIDMILGISDTYTKYTFKDNTFKINDFSLEFEGFFAMLKDGGYDMDLTYASKDNSFKSILSLVPGAYMKGFESIKTKGELSFGGVVKGQYNDNQMPAFNLALAIENAMFQYPDLPTSVTDINVKTNIDNKDGVINNTTINVSQFHLKIGDNPFDATLFAHNIDDVIWDFKVNGKIDLGNIEKIMPLEKMTIAGIVNMDLQSKGQLSVVEAEKYDQLTTSGSMQIDNMKYTSEDLTYDIGITKADASFDPKEVKLSALDMQIGKSDMRMTGNIANYIPYILDSGQVIKGAVNFSSTMLDLDEFMAESPESNTPEANTEGEASTTSTPADSTSTLEAVPIPRNIDFTMNTSLKTIKMMDMTLIDTQGKLVIRDGIAYLNGLKTSTLGGLFTADGNYNTQNEDNHSYDMNMDIKDLSISEACKTFSIVKKYVPMAEKMSGNVSSSLTLGGLLESDYMPVYNSINGKGKLEIAQASLKSPKFLKSISKITSIAGNSLGDELSLDDVTMSFTIKDGNLHVKPFDVKIGNSKTRISGSSSVDGQLDYKMDIEVPAGNLGAQANNLLNKYTGRSSSSSTIKLPIAIGGTYDKPTYKLVGGSLKEKAKEEVKEVVKDIIKDKVGINIDSLKQEKEKQRQNLIKEAEIQAENLKAEAKRAADKVRSEGYAQADKLVEEAGSNFFKKTIAEEAAKKLKKETDKKALKLEEAAQRKADVLLIKAKEKADAL